MTIAYLIVAPLAWVVAGSCKFLINSVLLRRAAWKEVGLGGMPSTHTAVASSPAWLIGITQGLGESTLAVAIALALIVAIDALDTRNRIAELNALMRQELSHIPGAQSLRARTGHSLIEVLAGFLVGGFAAVAALLFAKLIT